MMHVDALSRVINYIEAMPLEKELQLRQLQDSKLKALSEKLDTEKMIDLNFLMVLFLEIVQTNLVLSFPMVMVDNIIRYYHDNMVH